MFIILEFPLWCSRKKSNQYPWGSSFNPWPCFVGPGSGVAVSCGVGCRHGSDPAFLWLWRRPAAATPIRPLAWVPPYAAGTALEKAKRPKKKKKKKGLRKLRGSHCLGFPQSLLGNSLKMYPFSIRVLGPSWSLSQRRISQTFVDSSLSWKPC